MREFSKPFSFFQVWDCITETVSVFIRFKYWLLNVLRVSPLQFMLQISEVFNLIFLALLTRFCWSQWPRGLRCGSAAARLLRLWVRIPPGPRMFVCCDCCVLSGRGLCDRLITHPEESYRLLCVILKPREWGGLVPLEGGLSCQKQTNKLYFIW